MRATSMDELAQLINVIMGEMSLVGPRPERPEFVGSSRSQIRRYGERHRVKAGMTGWARQVHGLRGRTSIADRAEWDNYYIENRSLTLDFQDPVADGAGRPAPRARVGRTLPRRARRTHVVNPLVPLR